MCAAASAALKEMQRHNLPQQAAEKGAWLVGQLRERNLPKVREVRGLGLLIGLELKERVQPILGALLERGVLALPAGPTVLRLLPPLVITYDDLETVVERVSEVLGEGRSDSGRERINGLDTSG